MPGGTGPPTTDGAGQDGENGGAENGALLAAGGPATHAPTTPSQHLTTTLHLQSQPNTPPQDLKIFDTPTNSVWVRQVDGNECRENGSCYTDVPGRREVGGQDHLPTFPIRHTLISLISLFPGPDSPRPCLPRDPWCPASLLELLSGVKYSPETVKWVCDVEVCHGRRWWWWRGVPLTCAAPHKYNHYTTHISLHSLYLYAHTDLFSGSLVVQGTGAHLLRPELKV